MPPSHQTTALRQTATLRQTDDLPENEPIAIIGMGCHYPGDSQGPESYWQLLRRGDCAIREIPPDRWPHAAYQAEANQTGREKPSLSPQGKSASRWGGFLSAPFPASFDAALFDLPPQEAQALDPQQRLLLEVSWRACEDAGLVPDPDQGRQIGVFVGISTTDYHGATLWQPGLKAIDAFTATGASFAAAAGRLSYVFGFEGPCLAIDTACSSSLVAIHQASQALRLGECEAALVAGVNALLTPNLYVCLTSMGLMAADGRCKAFDATGDGYVRAEGCGALVLKTLSRARQDGDRILALIRGSAVNQDGRSNGLTAPRRQAQERVITQALAQAHLSPQDIDYVEAHGTGTPLGDVIELSALGETYAAGRDAAAPLLVGSAKTNIGHLEAGAGMAGLIKAILALRHGEIPAHLHLTRPTPEINWSELAIQIPRTLTPWPQTGHARRAAVSAFGFSGTNAHVILEEAPSIPATAATNPALVLLPLSARSPNALAEAAITLADWLEEAARRPSPPALADIALTLGQGRRHFAHRRAVVGGSLAELATRLRDQIPAKADQPEPNQPEQPPLRAKLSELGRLWVEGGSLDWARLSPSQGAGKISLPGHPFQRQPYWRNPVLHTHDTRDNPAPTVEPSPLGLSVTVSLSALRDFIEQRARRVLSDQPRPPLDFDIPLLEQGFTSLMALELRRALERDLGQPVPPTVFFNYPTLTRMAGFFLRDASPPQTPPPDKAISGNPHQSQGDEPTDFTFLDTLNDEDLASLIDAELELL